MFQPAFACLYRNISRHDYKSFFGEIRRLRVDCGEEKNFGSDLGKLKGQSENENYGIYVTEIHAFTGRR